MLSEAFWTPNIASSQFDEYFQLGLHRKVRPIKNQLGSPNTSNSVREQTFAQLRTGLTPHRHMAFTQPTGVRQFQICFPLHILIACCCLPTSFLCTKAMRNRIWHLLNLRMGTCLFRSYLDAGSSLTGSRCLSRSILFIAVVCTAHSLFSTSA